MLSLATKNFQIKIKSLKPNKNNKGSEGLIRKAEFNLGKERKFQHPQNFRTFL